MKYNLASLTIGAGMFLAFGQGMVTAAQAESKTSAFSVCAAASSNQVVVRNKCRRNERKISLADISAASLPGPQGPKGDTGAQGPKGDTGAQGLKGDTGLQGAKGDTGATGSVGPQGAMGIQGPVGATGAVGPVGPQGPRGLSGFSEIPQGTTIYGVVGADYHADTIDSQWGTAASFQAIPPTHLQNALVAIANNTVVDNDCAGATCLDSEELPHAGRCTGTAENPSAPAGYVCIYPTGEANAFNLRATALPNDNGRYGFFVRWRADSLGRSAFRGIWAYTAP